MKTFTDFYQWEGAVWDNWPAAVLSDNGTKHGLRSYFDMRQTPGQREVARWNKSYNDGWVKSP